LTHHIFLAAKVGTWLSKQPRPAQVLKLCTHLQMCGRPRHLVASMVHEELVPHQTMSGGDEVPQCFHAARGCALCSLERLGPGVAA
jgi:hypothetical protein